jgi:hypothetical protein
MEPTADDQSYYFSDEWQADERESLAAIERGEGRTFARADDAIRWLLNDDDPPA